jgi:DNA-binding IscR family transcriptional regulator
MKFHRDEELAFNLLDILGRSDEFHKVRDLVGELQTTELFIYSIVLKLKKAKLVETLPGVSGGIKRVNGPVTAYLVMKALNRLPKKLSGKSAELATNIVTLLQKEQL